VSHTLFLGSCFDKAPYDRYKKKNLELFFVKENGFPGNFIVIEGPDASGKETQTGLLTEWLRDSAYSNIDPETENEIIDKMPGKYPDPSAEKVKDNIESGVWRLSFPTYSQTPGGRVVQTYLNGDLGDREGLEMKEIVDIFAADRKQFRLIIKEFLSKGGIIICDRYREANLIHQLVGFEDEEWEKKLKDFKSIDADLPDAELIFYLDISPEEALERMSDKDKDMHELDDSYMKKSNLNGRKVAEYEGWEIVDGERSKEEVFKSLKEIIDSEILNK
jgi:thymidylate kinase